MHIKPCVSIINIVMHGFVPTLPSSIANILAVHSSMSTAWHLEISPFFSSISTLRDVSKISPLHFLPLLVPCCFEHPLHTHPTHLAITNTTERCPGPMFCQTPPRSTPIALLLGLKKTRRRRGDFLDVETTIVYAILHGVSSPCSRQDLNYLCPLLRFGSGG